MSVDYTARLIYGYKITEEQAQRIEMNYDIVHKLATDSACRVDTWMVCENHWFFGVSIAHLDLNYDEYVEPIYAPITHANLLNHILDTLHLKLDSYPRTYLINNISY